MRPPAIAAMALVVWACGDSTGPAADLGGPNPDQDEHPIPARLLVTVDVEQFLGFQVDGFGGRIQVDAFLELGTNEAGQPRQILDNTLRVLEFEFDGAPSIRRRTDLEYHGIVPVNPDRFARSPLEVHPPLIEGIQAEYAPLLWRVPVRAGDEMVRVSQGEDLRLAIDMPRAPSTPPPQFLNWWLSVDRVTLSANGPFDNEFVVPAELLPQPTEQPSGASLRVRQSRVGFEETESYIITPEVEARTSWLVEFVD